MRSRKRSSKRRGDSKSRRWSARVTKQSNALDLESKIFKSTNPRRIALSLKRSAQASESAIRRGLVDLKIFDSRSSALLCFVTRADQRWFFESPRLFDDFFRVDLI